MREGSRLPPKWPLVRDKKEAARSTKKLRVANPKKSLPVVMKGIKAAPRAMKKAQAANLKKPVRVRGSNS